MGAIITAFKSSSGGRFVRGGTASGSGTSCSYTFPVPNTVGNAIYVLACVTPDSAVSITVNDTSLNSYAPVATLGGSPGGSVDMATGKMFAFQSIGVGGAAVNTVTVTFSSPATTIDLIVAEYAGLTAVDSATWQATDVDSVSPLAGAASQSSDLIVVGAFNASLSKLKAVATAFDYIGGGLTIRFQTNYPTGPGPTAILAEYTLPTAAEYSATIALPPPVFPPTAGGTRIPAVTAPVSFGEYLSASVWQSPMGAALSDGGTTESGGRPTFCGPYEFYDAATGTFLLYAIQETHADPAIMQVLKSTDGGATWLRVVTSSSPSMLLSASKTSYSYSTLPLDSSIWVIYRDSASGSLMLTSFDMSSETWSGTYYTVPNSGSGHDIRVFDFSFSLSSGTWSKLLVYYTEKVSGVFQFFHAEYGGSPLAWTATQLTTDAVGGILAGFLVDPETYVPSAFTIGNSSPTDVRLWSGGSYTTIISGLSGDTNQYYPIFGPGAVWKGNTFLPYARWTGAAAVPAFYQGAGSSWATSDLTTGRTSPYRTDMAALVVNDALAIFWSETADDLGTAANRLMCAFGYDPGSGLCFYNSDLYPPQPDGGHVISTPSAALLFGTRIGVKVNIGAS